jgi:hypothetical protein
VIPVSRLGLAVSSRIRLRGGTETMNWPKYRNYWMIASVIALLPVVAQGQTQAGSVAVKASVSQIVALSVSPTLLQGAVQIDAHSDIRTLTLTLSGAASDALAVRVPILIRSNSGYKISALVQSQAVMSAHLAVLDARPTGMFVATDAVANLAVIPELDNRAKNGQVQTDAPNSVPLNSASFSVLSGPPVSRAGTLNSADNALEVTLSITV